MTPRPKHHPTDGDLKHGCLVILAVLAIAVLAWVSLDWLAPIVRGWVDAALRLG